MCTVTVVPVACGFRLACNRDEQRTRPIALPPRTHAIGRRQALWPEDPQSGGTWIGVNDAGLALVLLNRSGSRRTPPAPTSRGLIVPTGLAASSIADAVGRVSAELRRRASIGGFEPFTLLMVHRTEAAVLEHRAARTTVSRRRLQRPLLLTSSSLGDDLVDGPRRRLFEALMRRSRHPLEAQARFHTHRWRERPQVSIDMSRHDAVTVSRTVVSVLRSQISFDYCPTS